MIAKTKLGRIFTGALIAFVFIGILGVSLIHPVLANGDDHDDDDDYDDDIEIKYEEDGVEVHVIGDKGGYELKLEGDEPQFELEYKTADGTTETETEFEVQFESLIEYNDANGNGFYDEDEEEVQVLYLESDEEEEDDEKSSGAVHWLPPTFENLTLENGFMYKLTLASDPSRSNGLDMQIVVYVSVVEAVIPETDTTVDNFTIKIDIIIASFPWIEDDSNLALKVEIETEHETEEEEHEDEDEHEDEHEVTSKLNSDFFSGGAAEIYFAWKETAIIDEGLETEKEVPVNSTKLVKNDDEGEETEEKIYLCYPHFTTLLHDPTLGINYVSGHKTLVISVVIAAVVVVAAAALVLVKRH